MLRHRDFRFLWLAQSSSVIGDNIVLVALALFVVARTGSATDLGFVLGAGSLPLVTFLLFGGVWADRLPRHRVMIVTDLVRFGLHAVLAALIFTGAVRIWQVIAIEMCFGTAEAFFRPAATGLLPQTVPEEDIQQATAITSMSNNVAEFLGPALASALVLGAGAGWAFALDAATFLLSAAFLTQVRPRRRAGDPDLENHHERASVWASIREGSREVRAHVWVWATLASFCVALFCGLAPWLVLGPVIAREQYGHLAVYGLVEAALGFGTILGSIIGVGWRPRYPMRLAMLAILPWPAVAFLYATGVTLFVVVPATVLGGVGIALFDVWWLTALAERIPPEKLSRVTSYDWMISLALLPLGYLLAGPLAATLGAVTVLIGGSALAMIAFGLGMLPRETRMLERLDKDGAAAPRIGEETLPGLVRHRAGATAGELPCASCGARAVADTELAEAMLEVLAHGAVADRQLRGHVPVGATDGHEPQHLGLASRHPRAEQRLAQEARNIGAGPRAEVRVRDRVEVGLDQEGAAAVDEIALLIAVVLRAAAERDREHPLGAPGKRERDLVLDAERRVDALVERKAVQLVRGGHIRKAVCAPVERLAVVAQQRVFVSELSPLGHERRFTRAHQRDDLLRARADVVE